MSGRRPTLIVIAGPNGAGKSTIAPSVLGDFFGVLEFVNADVIAQGLSGLDPERSAIAAGRIMLARLKELASMQRDFAFETTLASRSFAPWLAALESYRIHLDFVWLSSADLACRRVASRKASGGHGVADDVVRRRYERGLRNFFELYRPLAAEWRFFDNSSRAAPRLLARGRGEHEDQVLDPPLWRAIRTGGGESMVEERAGSEEEDLDRVERHAFELERVMRSAVREALLVHKKLGHSIVVADADGRIVTLTADEIVIEDEPAGERP